MLAMSLELKTMDLLRNGSPLSGKLSITDQELAEPAVITRLPLSLCRLQRLMLTSLDPQGKRTRLSSTDGLSRPQVVHGTTLQCLSQVLTVVSASVTVSSSPTGQVTSTRVSVVAAAAVTGLVITQEGPVTTQEDLVITQEGLVITQDRVITPDRVITTQDRVTIHGQVTSQGLQMMIMVLETLQALSCTHRDLQQTTTGIGSRGTLRSIV